MRAFSYVWSLNKDGGHTIKSAISENPMRHANLMALSFIEPELLAMEVYIVGIGIFNLFSAPVTLIRWPSYTNLTRIPWRYTGCVKTNLCQGFRKSSSDRQRDATENNIIHNNISQICWINCSESNHHYHPQISWWHKSQTKLQGRSKCHVLG